MAKMSKVLSAWEIAKMRTREANRIDAEAEAREQPKAIPKSDYFSMKKAFEAAYFDLTDDKTPPNLTWRRSWRR